MERKSLTVVLLSTILIAAFMMFIPLSNASAAEVKTLKVGCTLPLNVGFGVETKKALEIIVPAFNKAGGFDINGQKYKVDLIIYTENAINPVPSTIWDLTSQPYKVLRKGLYKDDIPV